MRSNLISKNIISLGSSLLILFILTIVFVTSASGAESVGTAVPSDLSESSQALELGDLVREPILHGMAHSSVISTSPFRTAPGDLPIFTVTKGDGQTGDGYIFIAYYNYWRLEQSAYLLILEDDGDPVYYKQLAPIPIAMDFKKQSNGLLTYFPLMDGGRFLAMDSSYQVVKSYDAGNGYETDFHDMQILENGHALLMIHDRRTIDMSKLVEGGDPEAIVTGCIIQEIDNLENVVFEWHSWDHIAITDSNQRLTDKEIKYIHCNSIASDLDGNILISSRNLDEVTKIDRQTGEIIWRLGGKGNDFEFLNDDGFNNLHDVRRLANGHITVFDNGITEAPFLSRGVEYELDEISDPMTATSVQEFRDTPDLYSRAMGNAQRLPNGNTVVGWGRSIDIPVLIEFDASGEKVLQFKASGGYGSYRAFRFPWEGYPTWPAALIAEEQEGIVRLYFSWNGSTETVSYQILGGRNRSQLQLLATVAKDGFETTYELDDAAEGLWYFQVVPVDREGVLGQASDLIPVAVGIDPLYLPVTLSG